MSNLLKPPVEGKKKRFFVDLEPALAAKVHAKLVKKGLRPTDILRQALLDLL